MWCWKWSFSPLYRYCKSDKPFIILYYVIDNVGLIVYIQIGVPGTRVGSVGQSDSWRHRRSPIVDQRLVVVQYKARVGVILQDIIASCSQIKLADFDQNVSII